MYMTPDDCLSLAQDCQQWRQRHAQVAAKVERIKHARVLNLWAQWCGFSFKHELQLRVSANPVLVKHWR